MKKFISVSKAVLREQNEKKVKIEESQKSGSTNPYVQFIRDCVPEIMNSKNKITKGEAFNLAKKRWVSLTEEQKQPYKDLSMRDSIPFLDAASDHIHQA